MKSQGVRCNTLATQSWSLLPEEKAAKDDVSRRGVLAGLPPFGFWGLVLGYEKFNNTYDIRAKAILAVATIHFTVTRHETQKKATNKKGWRYCIQVSQMRRQSNHLTFASDLSCLKCIMKHLPLIKFHMSPWGSWLRSTFWRLDDVPSLKLTASLPPKKYVDLLPFLRQFALLVLTTEIHDRMVRWWRSWLDGWSGKGLWLRGHGAYGMPWLMAPLFVAVFYVSPSPLWKDLNIT